MKKIINSYTLIIMKLSPKNAFNSTARNNNSALFIQDLKEGQIFKFINSPLKYAYGRLANGYNYYLCLSNGYSYESSRMNVKVELIN